MSLDMHAYVCSFQTWLNIPHTCKSQESVGLVYFMQASSEVILEKILKRVICIDHEVGKFDL